MIEVADMNLFEQQNIAHIKFADRPSELYFIPNFTSQPVLHDAQAFIRFLNRNYPLYLQKT